MSDTLTPQFKEEIYRELATMFGHAISVAVEQRWRLKSLEEENMDLKRTIGHLERKIMELSCEHSNPSK